MKPYTTLEEIKEEWQHIKNEDIKNIEIKFNEKLECIYFKSWEMTK